MNETGKPIWMRGVIVAAVTFIAISPIDDFWTSGPDSSDDHEQKRIVLNSSATSSYAIDLVQDLTIGGWYEVIPPEQEKVGQKK